MALDMVAGLAMKATLVTEQVRLAAATVGHHGVGRWRRRRTRHVTLLLGLRPAAVLLACDAHQSSRASFESSWRPALETASLPERCSLHTHWISVGNQGRPAIHGLAEHGRSPPAAVLAYQTSPTILPADQRVPLVTIHFAHVSFFEPLADNAGVLKQRSLTARSLAAVVHAFLQTGMVELPGGAPRNSDRV